MAKRAFRAAEDALRAAGRNRDELFVLWTGAQSGDLFEVRSAYVPAQTAEMRPDGVCVTVEGEELHRLNRWLYERAEVLAVQIHTHPSKAYHSITDDTYPIVTMIGGASIVVPDFGRRGLLPSDAALFRLTTSGWVREESEIGDVVMVV